VNAPTARAIATARIPGIDVARSLAILGMVLVNFKYQMDAAYNGPAWLVWISDRADGRAAALFVVLAGLGVSLRSRRAREDPTTHLGPERRALLQRAVLLFGLGLLNLHMWDWDILHFYGVYLALAALLLRLPSLGLAALATAVTAATVGVSPWYEAEWGEAFWTVPGCSETCSSTACTPCSPGSPSCWRACGSGVSPSPMRGCGGASGPVALR